MEGLSESEANLVVYIQPSQSKNVAQAILRELSSLLLKFNEALGGVVLAYNFHPPNDLARIVPGVHPYIGVKIKANLLLFSPKPNMLLEGKVVKVFQESIHAIVLGFASVNITQEEIRDEFRYKSKRGEGYYVSKSHKRHRIKAGTIIRFVVKSLDEEVLLMSGSLIPANTGSITWFNKYSEDAATNSSKRRRAETNEETELKDHKVKKHRVADH